MKENEGNRLIAEFMGATPCKDAWGQDAMEHPDWYHEEWSNNIMGYFETHSYKFSDLKYHLSWDWLMPVIDKIEELGYIVTIVGTNCYIDGDHVAFRSKTYDKLQSAFETVIEFAEWYLNKNSDNNK